VLASSGTTPGDTSVGYATASGRTIVLRHPADDAIFLIVTIPPVANAPAGDSGRVAIQPFSGKYQFAIGMSGTFPAGIRATFSYGIHLATPPGAVARYPSPERLEAVLTPVEVSANGKLQALAAERPAADMMRFTVTEPGTYALVFPR